MNYLPANYNLQYNLITAGSFPQLMQGIEELYDIGIDFSKCRSSIGRYHVFFKNGDNKLVYTVNDFFQLLIELGVDVNLQSSHKVHNSWQVAVGDNLQALVMGTALRAIPEEIEVVFEVKPEPHTIEFSVDVVNDVVDSANDNNNKKEENNGEENEGQGFNPQEMDENRIEQSVEGTDQEDQTTEATLTGARIVGTTERSDQPVEVKEVRTDVENIPWKTMNGPKFSKEDIVSLASEFGLGLDIELKKPALLKAFKDSL